VIVPSAADILRSIEHTLETVIRPALKGTTEQSAAATIAHLLRHVTLRIEGERRILIDDIGRLKALLATIDRYCRTRDEPRAAGIAAEIVAATREPGGEASPHATLEGLGSRANELRRLLMSSLDYLIFIRTMAGNRPDYQALRTDIRRYMAQQLSEEAQLIHPAFEGRGPRR
jgi:hypothetical protein